MLEICTCKIQNSFADCCDFVRIVGLVNRRKLVD